MRDLAIRTLHDLRKGTIFSNFVNLSTIQLSNALILVLIYPILTRIVGVEAFGEIMVVNAFAGLMGIIINYGTNQSGVKSIAVCQSNSEGLSAVFYDTLLIRLAIFTLFGISFFALNGFLTAENFNFYFLALPLIFAEVLNPLFLFLGKEQLLIYSLGNLFSKLLVLAAVILLIEGPQDAPWVNFYIGSITSISYFILILIGIYRFRLSFIKTKKVAFLTLLKGNFYLVGNNISVHLQQSLMLFVLDRWGTASWLGAYSICDKVIWSTRLIIMSVSNALYPKSAKIFQERPGEWPTFREKSKRLIGLLFLCCSLVLLLVPELVIRLIAGQADPNAIQFLRLMAFLPVIAALNCMNVTDLLLKNKTQEIFYISIVLLLVAGIFAFSLAMAGNPQWFGSYVLIIELTALLMYEYRIRKPS